MPRFIYCSSHTSMYIGWINSLIRRQILLLTTISRMLSSSSSNIFQYLLFKKALLNLWSIFQFVDKMEFDAWYSNSVIIMPIGSNIRLVLMRDMLLLFLYSKEALKACLLPKKTHYFLCVHSKTKRVKKQPMGQYQKACPFNETFESNEAITNKKGE